jgi:hypothetical protein
MIRHSKISLLLLTLFVTGTLLTGCDATMDATERQKKQKESTSFGVNDHTFTSGDTIIATLNNQSARSIYWPEPNAELTLEQKTDAGWNNLGTWYMTIQVVPEAVPLEPAKEYTFDISADVFIDNFGEGTYRLRQHLYTTDNLSEDYRYAVYTDRFTIEK